MDTVEVIDLTGEQEPTSIDTELATIPRLEKIVLTALGLPYHLFDMQKSVLTSLQLCKENHDADNPSQRKVLEDIAEQFTKKGLAAPAETLLPLTQKLASIASAMKPHDPSSSNIIDVNI